MPWRLLIAGSLLAACTGTGGVGAGVGPAPRNAHAPAALPSTTPRATGMSRPHDVPAGLAWAYDAARAAVPGIEADQRLSAAANALADRLAAQRTPPGRRERARVAVEAGIAEPVPLMAAAESVAGDRRALAEGLARVLGERCRPIGCNRVGIAAWSESGRDHVVALAMASRLELEPVALLTGAGAAIRLAGRVLPPARGAEVVVATPIGSIETIHESSSAVFDVTYVPTSVGPHRIEIVSTEGGSPVVVGLLPVCVGCRGLAAPPEPPAGRTTEPEEAARRIAALVAELRASVGLAPLAHHDGLARAAHEHARDMRDAGYFSHRGRSGSTPGDRVVAQGVVAPVVYENLALARSAEDAFLALLESPVHLRSIVARDVTHLGVGVASGQTSLRVVVVLARVAETPGGDDPAAHAFAVIGGARAARAQPPVTRDHALDEAAAEAASALAEAQALPVGSTDHAQETASRALANRGLPSARAVIVSVDDLADLAAVEALAAPTARRAGVAVVRATPPDTGLHVVVLLAE